jgi:hypothetical protein
MTFSSLFVHNVAQIISSPSPSLLLLLPASTSNNRSPSTCGLIYLQANCDRFYVTSDKQWFAQYHPGMKKSFKG